MVKDIRGRNITNSIIEVVWTNAASEKLSKKEMGHSTFFFCEEFFRDNYSFSCTVPSYLSGQLNGNYFGWQKLHLWMLNKELYRPVGQKSDVDGPVADEVDRYAISEAGRYDRHMSQKVWIRFVQDQEKFLERFSSAHRLSHGIRCKILKNTGFQFCGKRLTPDEERDTFGLELVKSGIEIWAHPHGLIATMKTADNMDFIYEITLYAKFRGGMSRLYDRVMRSGGGSYGYRGGVTSENCGVLAQYTSVNIDFLRAVSEDSTIIPHWGEGNSGLKNIWLWGYHEFNSCSGSDCWEQLKDKTYADARALSEEYPLLRQICCDAA